MTEIDIIKKLGGIFKDVFDDENLMISNDTTADDIDDWDSLAHINLIVAIEKDFNIKPNIVVAYIDQTNIGDELCRYKNNRVYDKNNTLVAVKNKNYSRALFSMTKINFISEIILLNNSQLERTSKLTNFFIKYGFIRAINKFIAIKKFG